MSTCLPIDISILMLLQFPANGTKPHTHRYARHGE